MAKDLVLDVIAKKNSRELSQLADEFDRLAHQTDDFGKKMHENATFSQLLDEELGKTRTRVKELGEEFDRTGSKDVFANLRGAQSNLKSLERIKADLSKALEDGAQQGGQEGAKQFSSAMQGELSTPVLGPIITGGILAAVLEAAPAVGAILMSGAALGGIAGGVVGQLHDPQVHAAIAGIGADLMHTLSASTTDFKQPLIAAATQIDQALSKITAGVDWKAAAADIAPLVTGLTSMVSNLLPGFNKMLESSGPIVGALGEDLASFGNDLSTMFELIAKGGKGAQEDLRLLVSAFGAVAVSIGAVILGLSKITEWATAAPSKIGHFLEDFRTGIKGIDTVANGTGVAIAAVTDGLNGSNDGMRHAAGAIVNYVQGLQKVGQSASLSAGDLNTLSKAAAQTADINTVAAQWVDRLFGEMMGVDQATLHWHESLTQLHDTLTQNGLAIDRHTHLLQDSTKAGEENRAAILQAVQANEQQYQAMVASGISSQDAAKAYDQNTAALEKQLHAAGYTSAQIDDLIGKYRRVPDKVNTALAVQGLTEALNNLGNLIAEVNHLDGRQFGFTITANVYDPSGLTRNREGRAQGGPVSAGTAYTIGEEGPELFVPSTNGYIVPNRMLNARSGYATPMSLGGSSSGNPVYVTINAGLGTNGYDLGRQVAEVLRPYVRGRGGDVQIALGT